MVASTRWLVVAIKKQGIKHPMFSADASPNHSLPAMSTPLICSDAMLRPDQPQNPDN